MVEDENHISPEPPRAHRERLGAQHPPGPMRRRSTIPPPPLPVAQPHLPMPIPQVDEECVTKRFYVNVFQPVELNVAAIPDTDATMDSIQITPEDTPQVTYNQTLFDLDEDEVTKEIRIQRIGALPPKKGVNSAAMKVRTLPTDDTLWKTGLSRRPGSATIPKRPGTLRSMLPSVRAALKMVFAFFSSKRPAITRQPNRSAAGALNDALARKDQRSRLKLSVNSYTRGLYHEIKNALKPGSAGAVPVVDKAGFSIAISEPPRIAVNAVLLRRADKYSLLIRGRASHPVAIRDIMVFADKKKILYLSNALRDDAGYMEFSADVPLLGAISTILVVARHDDQVMGSQSLMIKKSDTDSIA